MSTIFCSRKSLNRLQRQKWDEAMRKMRQDVAAHLFAHHKTACLLTLSPLACHEAACSEPVKRRFLAWSGRRGSNPRQPAWKADRRDNAARSLSSGFKRAFTNRVRYPSSNVADGHAMWEADAYLLSLLSYLLLIEKARPIGTMFYMTVVPIMARSSQLG